MAKLKALGIAVNFCRLGHAGRDKAALFCISLLNQLDHRRRRMRYCVANALAHLSRSNDSLSLTIEIAGRILPLAARLNDYADYQTIGECLGSMYHAPAGPVLHVLDGGGNIGLFSMVAAARLATEDVMVVEPDPENFGLLHKNLAFAPRVRKLQAALAAYDGECEFSKPASNTGFLSGRQSGALAGPSRRVPTHRIASVIPRDWDLSRTWIKLDIEGAEYEVLRDMLACGMKPRYISAELHDYLRAGGKQLVEELRAAGYRIEIEGFGAEGNVCRQLTASLQ